MQLFELGLILATLIPHLPLHQYPGALKMARETWSSYALTALVPLVADEMRKEIVDEALAASQDIRNPIQRVCILAKLLPQLPVDSQWVILQEMLTEMQQADFSTNLASLLQVSLVLTEVWANFPRQQVYEELWQKTLRTYAAQPRASFLTALLGLLLVILSLGGKKAVIETTNAILEICRQWTWV